MNLIDKLKLNMAPLASISATMVVPGLPAPQKVTIRNNFGEITFFTTAEDKEVEILFGDNAPVFLVLD
jgi:hypothetical protein